MRIFFIILLSLLTLNISAQIQRLFLGNTLGVSTYDQVRYNMYDKGYQTLEDHRNNYISYRDVRFAGYTSKEAYFYFYDKNFYMVTFIIKETDNTKDTFDSLKGKLQNKYPNHKVDEEENVVTFHDNTTLLVLRNNTSKEEISNKYSSLTYIDLNLSKKRIDDEMNKNYSDEL